jgi:sugar phosphate isomerase/epimerase
MLPGISTQVFYPQRLAPAHLDALASSGVDVIELFAARFHFDFTDRQQLRELGAWFRSNEVRPALHAPITSDTFFSRHAYPNLNLVSSEKAQRIEAMEEIKRALEAAEKIPFATCVLHLGLDADVWSDHALEHALTAVEHLKAFAGPLGVKLLLENLRNGVATPTHLLDILRIGHFDSTGICLDMGHLNLTLDTFTETFAQVFEELSPRIAELHLHDNHGGTGGPNPGKPDEHLWPASGTERPSTLATGTIPWEEIYSLIATLPTEIPGVLEIHDQQSPDLAFATRLAREVFSHAARLFEATAS